MVDYLSGMAWANRRYTLSSSPISGVTTWRQTWSASANCRPEQHELALKGNSTDLAEPNVMRYDSVWSASGSQILKAFQAG